MDSGGPAFSQAKTSRQVYLWSLVGVLNESYGLSSARCGCCLTAQLCKAAAKGGSFEIQNSKVKILLTPEI